MGDRTLRGLLATFLFVVACGGGGGIGGGLGIDGGRSGTGILASVRGNVVSTAMPSAGVAGIRVTIEGTELQSVTDQSGLFLLEGEIEGEQTLVFEDDDSPASASTTVFVPTGGLVDLTDVDVDFENAEVMEGDSIVEFEGTIEGIDCAAGTILVSTRFNRDLVTFEVALEDTVIEDMQGATVDCSTLGPETEVEIYAEVDDAGNVISAVVVLENESDDDD